MELNGFVSLEDMQCIREQDEEESEYIHKALLYELGLEIKDIKARVMAWQFIQLITLLLIVASGRHCTKYGVTAAPVIVIATCIILNIVCMVMRIKALNDTDIAEFISKAENKDYKVMILDVIGSMHGSVYVEDMFGKKCADKLPCRNYELVDKDGVGVVVYMTDRFDIMNYCTVLPDYYSDGAKKYKGSIEKYIRKAGLCE